MCLVITGDCIVYTTLKMHEIICDSDIELGPFLKFDFVYTKFLLEIVILVNLLLVFKVIMNKMAESIALVFYVVFLKQKRTKTPLNFSALKEAVNSSCWCFVYVNSIELFANCPLSYAIQFWFCIFIFVDFEVLHQEISMFSLTLFMCL